MTIDGSSRIGMAQLVRAGKIILSRELNAVITAENAYWKPLDERLAEELGVEFTPVELEPVEASNFYLGHNPSLVEAEVDKYPNVAVDADRTGSSGSDDLDQGQTHGISLYIEFMVKSEKSEEEASDRAMRMLDAINTCLMSNRTLGGTINELDDTPTAQLSMLFVREGRASYASGDVWYWRGGRMQYVVKKVAVPGSGNVSFTSADLAGIDQA